MARKKKPTVGQLVVQALNEFIESGELQKLIENSKANPPKVKAKSLPARPKADDKEGPPKKGHFQLEGTKARDALKEWAFEVLFTGGDGYQDRLAEDVAGSARFNDFCPGGHREVVEWMRHVAWLAKVIDSGNVDVNLSGFTVLHLGTRGQSVALLVEDQCENTHGWTLKVDYDYGKDSPGNESVVFIDKLLKIKGN